MSLQRLLKTNQAILLPLRKRLINSGYTPRQQRNILLPLLPLPLNLLHNILPKVMDFNNNRLLIR